MARGFSAPVSTIFSRVHWLEKEAITRATCQLSLATEFPYRYWMFLNGRQKPIADAIDVLIHHPCINTLCRVGPSRALAAEGFFPSLLEFDKLQLVLDRLGVTATQVYPVLASVVWEGFLRPRE